MRLRFSGSEAGPTGLKNFGDELNRLIFPAVLPGYFESAYTDVDLLGIGSILGMLVPEEGPERRTVVFSSGVGGGGRKGYGLPPRQNGLLDVVCVRGPLTAAAMGLPPAVAVADGALLLRHLLPGDLPRESVPVFVPHLSSALSGGAAWEAVCEAIGVRYLDPCTEDVLTVIDALRRAPLVLAEAMHAAIVADTFGTPWIPVSTNRGIDEFKWRDWSMSVGHVHDPVRLPRLLAGDAVAAEIARRAGLRNWTLPAVVPHSVDRVVGGRRTRQATAALRSLISAGTPVEPIGSTVSERVQQLLERLEVVRHRYPLR